MYTAKTNVEELFLKLVKKHFPKGYKYLMKILKRSLKVA